MYQFQTPAYSLNLELTRRPTVLIHIGKRSLSKNAFQLGAFLALLQLLDAILTFVGISLFGPQMEGNPVIRALIFSVGCFPALFLIKFLALTCIAWFTLQAHSRYWIRPLIGLVSLIYLLLAIFPWTFLISSSLS